MPGCAPFRRVAQSTPLAFVFLQLDSDQVLPQDLAVLSVSLAIALCFITIPQTHTTSSPMRPRQQQHSPFALLKNLSCSDALFLKENTSQCEHHATTILPLTIIYCETWQVWGTRYKSIMDYAAARGHWPSSHPTHPVTPAQINHHNLNSRARLQLTIFLFARDTRIPVAPIPSHRPPQIPTCTQAGYILALPDRNPGQDLCLPSREDLDNPPGCELFSSTPHGASNSPGPLRTLR